MLVFTTFRNDIRIGNIVSVPVKVNLKKYLAINGRWQFMRVLTS